MPSAGKAFARGVALITVGAEGVFEDPVAATGGELPVTVEFSRALSADGATVWPNWLGPEPGLPVATGPPEPAVLGGKPPG